MFAVITAIVTIEPTAADSIRKAFVRFPASAIGAGFAVLFTYLFGDTPLAYGFVTLLTIIVCYNLKLYDGILVATITGVAMISTVHHEYMSSFFIRLGTTTTGLVVSSLVNILIMPPSYKEPIEEGIRKLFLKASEILQEKVQGIIDQDDQINIEISYQKLEKETDKVIKLCNYQMAEWKFHQYKREELRHTRYLLKTVNVLRQINFHIGNLLYLENEDIKLNEEKRERLQQAVASLLFTLKDEHFPLSPEHMENMEKITKWFSEQQSDSFKQINPKQHFYISPETAMLYEIISINELAEELHQLYEVEKKHLQLINSSANK